MRYAGFWRRTAAYLIDVIPIVVVVAAVFYAFFGFDEVLRDRLGRTDDVNARFRFLWHRNMIRNLSFLVWLVYCTTMEAGPLQGTLGKFLLRMKVVDYEGNRLTLLRAVARNAMKLPSLAALAIGFIWVAFSKKKQGWHDLAARTLVISRNATGGDDFNATNV